VLCVVNLVKNTAPAGGSLNHDHSIKVELNRNSVQAKKCVSVFVCVCV